MSIYEPHETPESPGFIRTLAVVEAAVDSLWRGGVMIELEPLSAEAPA